MDKVKQILICVVPFVVTTIMLFPLAAIVGGGFDPFLWERADRSFYAICSVAFGFALMLRVLDEEDK